MAKRRSPGPFNLANDIPALEVEAAVHPPLGDVAVVVDLSNEVFGLVERLQDTVVPVTHCRIPFRRSPGLAASAVDSMTAVSIRCRFVEHLVAFGFGDR
jgi:hypothetical protein